jgi:homoserine kinase type II
LDGLDDATLQTQAVHNDYRAANILWNDGKICAVLDFEDLRWGYRVNDLAWAAVHLGTRYHNWGPVSTAVHDAFLAGYQASHSLTDVEAAWLPLLMDWHSTGLAQA